VIYVVVVASGSNISSSTNDVIIVVVAVVVVRYGGVDDGVDGVGGGRSAPFSRCSSKHLAGSIGAIALDASEPLV
jgi:hypothetical protein